MKRKITSLLLALALLGLATPAAARDIFSPEAPATLRYATVNLESRTDTLPMRTQPADSGEVMDVYPNGTVVAILQEVGDYCEVIAWSARGYMERASLLVDGDPGKVELTRLTYAAALANDTKLYAFPDAKSPAVATAQQGWGMEIVTVAGTWYYVRLDFATDDGTAYAFLRAQDAHVGNYNESAPEDPNRYAIVVNPASTDRLNLREGPTTEANSLGRFVTGAQVALQLDKGAPQGWYAVAIAGLEGFMMGEFLREVDPTSNASW